jgi:hypothetical protein
VHADSKDTESGAEFNDRGRGDSFPYMGTSDTSTVLAESRYQELSTITTEQLTSFSETVLESRYVRTHSHSRSLTRSSAITSEDSSPAGSTNSRRGSGGSARDASKHNLLSSTKERLLSSINKSATRPRG